MSKDTKKLLGKIIMLSIIVLTLYIYNNYIDTDTDNEDNVQLREESNEKSNEKATKQTKPTVKTTDSDKFKIYFVDVGQADCILITNNGENALVDAGNNEDGDKLVNYFQGLGISNFKYVIGTHAHEDHIGGMDNIIRSFNVEHFYMPDVVTTTRTFEDIVEALEDKQVGFETPDIDSTFSMADVKFKVLYIGEEDGSDLNDTSIVLKVTYKNTSYLLTGDATNSVEKKILDKDLESDVLKVGHHGSQYSSTTAFIKKVNPKYAIIEVGKNNTYNHPKDITLNKLKKVGAKIYRTDKDGTIILSSDGENIYFETSKTDTNG